MAITLQTSALLSALRMGASTEETQEAERLLTFATQTISDYLGDAYATAPEAIVNEAAVRIAGYLFDMPFATRGAAYANALRNSGAGAMLLPYRVHRAGAVGDAEAVAMAQEAVGTPGNPVTGIGVSGEELTITFADGSERTLTLPAGGDGTDQTARAAAAQAQSTATSAAAAAQAAQNTADDAEAKADEAKAAADAAHGAAVVGVVDDDYLPGAPVAMRLGWNQSRAMSAAIFTRANTHPVDGAVSGMSNGLAAPPFPPALDTDPTLFLGLWLEGDPTIATLPDGFALADKRALSVDGTAGHYFPSTARLPASTAGQTFRVVVSRAAHSHRR